MRAPEVGASRAASDSPGEVEHLPGHAEVEREQRHDCQVGLS
jgi:hypothetical protein